MASREIIQVFEQFQKARVHFVQTVAELANRPRNIEALQNAGVMALLRPLLLDSVPNIQQSAAVALGRLANHSDELAEAVVAGEILPQLVYSLSEQNRFYKKAAAYVLRSVAKHSPQLAQSVVDSGAIESLVACLEEFDPGVKESAAWALGYIARHTAELAQAVVDGGAIAPLVLCVQEPEITLKRIAASALSDIAKHSPELAQAVVDAEAIPNVAPLIENQDSKLKRQVCSCLAQIAKHSVDLAELVVDGQIFPKIFLLLKDADDVVRKNAATCVREIAKHTPELAQLIVNAGGLGPLVDYVAESEGNNKLAGIMALGYIAAFSETLALAVITSKAILPVAQALANKHSEDHIKSASAWTLGQIGRHSPEHAKAVADGNVFPKLLDVYLAQTSSDDLKTKAKRALKNVVQKCVYLPALNPLLHQNAPENILKYVVEQFAKVLPGDVAERKNFVTSGGLARLQDIQADKDSKVRQAVDAINQLYPEDVVQFYSPGYSQTLLSKVEKYDPNMR